jgi:hypothetical protein
MESGAVAKKKYKTKNSERNYSVHAFEKENGRMRTKSVCSLPATNNQEAKTKGENFCTMVGYDFSHIKMIRQS